MGADKRRRRTGAFPPVYAYMSVDPVHGAGVAFDYSAEGWKVTTIKPVPGQAELEPDDVVLEIEGKSLVKQSQEQQVALFKQYIRPPKVILKVQRNHYCSLHSNQGAAKRMYELEGYGCKALRDYKNNPSFIKDRFMDGSVTGSGLDLRHSKLDTVKHVARTNTAALSAKWVADDSSCWRPGQGT